MSVYHVRIRRFWPSLCKRLDPPVTLYWSHCTGAGAGAGTGTVYASLERRKPVQLRHLGPDWGGNTGIFRRPPSPRLYALDRPRQSVSPTMSSSPTGHWTIPGNPAQLEKCSQSAARGRHIRLRHMFTLIRIASKAFHRIRYVVRYRPCMIA